VHFNVAILPFSVFFVIFIAQDIQF